jgi:hypothetical protein
MFASLRPCACIYNAMGVTHGHPRDAGGAIEYLAEISDSSTGLQLTIYLCARKHKTLARIEIGALTKRSENVARYATGIPRAVFDCNAIGATVHWRSSAER